MAVTALSAILGVIGYAKSEWDKLPPEEKARIRRHIRRGNVAAAKRIAKTMKSRKFKPRVPMSKRVRGKPRSKSILAKLGLNPCTWLWAGKKKKKKKQGSWY